ncbi:hypothetical protein LJ754_03205 [Arthrobacter sp. zg-Y40]|uniref:hypothetical protein n=1 Tax=Arthrobacter sp. zg-Y40 TaxID=2886939 RepID=UPI001D14B12D|nr:hypothetical protein [Arthrobacter sp. zg-Y40]MCC3278168.1 hypothetical protein [Arthrobacter sp. zg-Y40]
MTSNNHSQNRALQQDARAWSEFTGINYTAALRQMQKPLAQGILGERVSARQLIATLEDHPLIGGTGDDFVLGESGFYADNSWSFDGENDYIELALITEALRMFSPLAKTETPEVGSYTLKHTVEALLTDTPAAYVSNGRLIWAAAALGLPIAEYDGGSSLNLLIGVPDNEHDYLFKMVRSGQTRPQGHHFRPPGYEHLQAALARCAAGEPAGDPWVRPAPVVEEPATFHAWLLAQADRDEPIGDFATDYAEGIRTSAHRIAQTPDELVLLLNELTHSPEAYDAARAAIGEWLGTMEPSPGIRTMRISSHREDVGGYGAGSGDMERLEYRCPCGYGRIVEEHDNIPGFREHSHRIDCGQCREEWRFLEGRSVRDWALEPVL